MAARKDSVVKTGGALSVLIWISSVLLTSFSRATGASTPPQDQPFWGCGLVGSLPGNDGTETGRSGGDHGGVRALVDGLKATNRKYGGAKVSYWNWNFAPESGQRLAE
eukprot:CAMPEP_0113585386 /NCGR_PEP_ID=MMETSP0015_2-20120614/33669_1 /TAXON_ID=2838 /ORGANISM="Odontella" /LENGTH=107 /DNA_ID=CAMNT_0000490619 /DNA_START=26 /DNA_END=346 /DNA_ORIENTATION=- /assembly_acc=CAM_ASM_000160